MSNPLEPIDHQLIDPDALKVVHRLARHGHEAYLVGGCVRDLLLGRKPKDFDVATSATPGDIRDLFRNSRIIGRRFRLAHIVFGGKIIETSTFRKNPRDEVEELPPTTDEEQPAEDLMIRRDNVFGSAEDDARRRDFTMNGLFYDPLAHEVIDFVDGIADLERRMVRTIGDPDIRFQEDPLRILRAIKFAARLGLTIEDATLDAMVAHREEILKCAPARVLEEIYRLLREGSATRVFDLLVETHVLSVLLPEIESVWLDLERRQVLLARLAALDALAAESLLPNPVILGALSYGLLVTDDPGEGEGGVALERALGRVLPAWSPSRRDRDRLRQILTAQRRLSPGNSRRRRRGASITTQDFFVDALTLYRITCHTGESDPSALDRWNEQLAATPRPERSEGPPSGARRRRRRRPRRGGEEPAPQE